MTTTSQDRLRTRGHFTPTYLGLDRRATVSRHAGTPIVEAYNPLYHYWATERELTPIEVVAYLGEGYLRNLREWRD